MKRNLNRILMLFLISVYLIAACVPNDVFANENENSYEIILKNTSIFYTGGGFCYQNGVKKDITLKQQLCSVNSIDGKMYVSALILKDYFKIESIWDGETETITMKHNGHTVNMRLYEDAMYIDGKAKYITNKAMMSGETIILPMEEVFSAFGYYFKQHDLMCFVAKTKDVLDLIENVSIEDLLKFENLFENHIFEENFETIPKMNFKSDWGGSNLGNGIGDDGSGNKAAYMVATKTGWEGYQTQPIYRGDDFEKKDLTYKLSFSYKAETDFSGNKLGAAVFYNDGDTYVGMNSISSFIPEADGKYHRVTWYIGTNIAQNAFRTYDHDNITILLRLTSPDATAKGKIWIDDITLSGYTPNDITLNANLQSDKFAAWHILGDTVTYKTNTPEKFDTAVSITGNVYNLDNVLVDRVTVDKDKFVVDGWSYKPDAIGYYEAEFIANYIDGTARPIATIKTKAAGISIKDYNLTRRAFYVAATDTKPVEKRNEKFYYSNTEAADRAFHNAYHKIAGIMGYYGNRWISLNWGETAVTKGVESVKGQYDYTQMDNMLKYCKDNDIQKLIVCVMYTPYWALKPDANGNVVLIDSRGNKVENPNATTQVGAVVYANFAPKDINDWKNFIRETVTRYPSRDIMWEIWNEPASVPVAFWYDTPDAYRNLLITAYDTIKEIDPEIKVSIAGMGNSDGYIQFFKDLLEEDKKDPTGDKILDHLDFWAVHGDYDTISRVLPILEDNGKGDMPWINTEGYYTAHRPSDDTSKIFNASESIVNYLMQFKLGAQIVTQFNILNSYEEYEDGTIDYGMFRAFPYIEPDVEAAAVYNFMDMAEKDFEYKSEYKFDNGQVGVLFKNGDGNLLTLWNPDLTELEFDRQIQLSMTDRSQIVRLDGKLTDSETVPSKQVVYVKNVDEDKLNELLKDGENIALDIDYVRPRMRCLTQAGLEQEQLDAIIKMENPEFAPFNKDNFTVAEDITWVEDNYTWGKQTAENAPVGFSAKHTAYMDKEGFYLMVDVNDSSIVYPTNETTIWNADGLQFALKVSNTNSTPMHEFSVGKVNGKNVVYKEIETNELSDRPSAGYTPAKKIVESARVSIEPTERGLAYKVFLPAEQLWPYIHLDSTEYIRLSLCVNNDDGTGRLGWLQWGQGIASGGKNADLYNMLTFDAFKQKNENVE